MSVVAENRASIQADAGEAGKVGRWIGRGMSGLAVLFLTFDSVGKLLEVGPVIEGSAKLGFPPEVVFELGVVLLCGVITYVVPRTAVLGAILLTGYLGGAVATHVRVGDPLATHTLFPVYFGMLVWGGLFFRDARVRALLPVRR